MFTNFHKHDRTGLTAHECSEKGLRGGTYNKKFPKTVLALNVVPNVLQKGA